MLEVTPKEKTLYINSVNDIFIFARHYNANEPLWHYTTAAGLLAILDSGSIFSTQMGCLNDSSELRYFHNHFVNAFERALYLEQASPITLSLLDVLRNRLLDPAPKSPHYVTCFTRNENDLSQWRAYGGGENGFAICIDAGELEATSSSLVRRLSVCYDEDKNRATAEEVVKRMVLFYKKGVADRGGVSSLDFDKSFFPLWGSFLSELGAATKHPGFKPEAEVRILKKVNFQSEKTNIKFLPRSHLISTHIPIQCVSSDTGEKIPLPIKNIMVGPSRYPENSKYSVETKLVCLGYTHGAIPVTCSNIPVQSV